jgi:hypothetical protein
MFNPPWLRGDGVERNPDAYLEQQILPEERQSWLRSHVNWINGLGNGWVGKKILGLGQYGLAGLWELPDTPENKGRKLRQVVVKQAGGSKHAVDLLQAEARFLMLFRQTGTKHVVKMYRRFYTEKGQGAIPSTDPGGGEVGRIFLEYCQGGDFAGLLRAMNKYILPDLLNVAGSVCMLWSD